MLYEYTLFTIASFFDISGFFIADVIQGGLRQAGSQP